MKNDSNFRVILNAWQERHDTLERLVIYAFVIFLGDFVHHFEVIATARVHFDRRQSEALVGTVEVTGSFKSSHFSTGSRVQTFLATGPHTFSLTVVHCFSVTVVHTCSYLVLHSLVYLVTHTSSSRVFGIVLDTVSHFSSSVS